MEDRLQRHSLALEPHEHRQKSKSNVGRSIPVLTRFGTLGNSRMQYSRPAVNSCIKILPPPPLAQTPPVSKPHPPGEPHFLAPRFFMVNVLVPIPRPCPSPTPRGKRTFLHLGGGLRKGGGRYHSEYFVLRFVKSNFPRSFSPLGAKSPVRDPALRGDVPPASALRYTPTSSDPQASAHHLRGGL